MNKDQIKGRLTEAEGKAKEITGKVIGNKDIERKGSVEKDIGRTQADSGDRQNDLEKRTKI